MEDNKEMLKESLDKIKGMMYYDSEKTAFENEKVIEEQGIMGAPAGSVGNDRTSTRTTSRPRRSARQERRADRRADRTDRKSDFQTAVGNEPDVKPDVKPDVEQGVYTDFDSVWDYKFDGNMWYTHRKGQDKWISLAKYPVAIKKLNAKYFPSANNDVTEPQVVKTPEPGRIDTSQMARAGIKPPIQDKISSLGEEDEPEVEVKETAKEGGYTNMAPGFAVNESVSNKEQKRINKEARLNKKLGITL